MPTEQDLKDGLDPNILWTEQDLIRPTIGRGGCVPRRPVNDADAWPHYNTPLHRALWNGNFAFADVLLNYGADVDLCNAIGRTPLLEAVWRQKRDAVRFLLQRNSNVNIPSTETHVWYGDETKTLHGKGGQVCLEGALFNRDMATLVLLLNAGADVCPPSLKPWSMLDLAVLRDDLSAVGALEPIDTAKVSAKSPFDLESCNLCGPARALLEFTNGRELVPPSELYPVYSHARRLVKEQGKAQDAQGLIRCVFEILQHEAGITKFRKQRMDRLCSQCRTFQSQAGNAFKEQNALHFQLHADQSTLNVSASRGCRLCGIIADALGEQLHFAQRHGQVTEGIVDSPIFLEMTHREDNGQDPSISISASCGELSAVMSLGYVRELSLSFAADDGEPDASTESSNAMRTAKQWLQTCREDDAHSACRQRQQGDMPRRLVHIGGQPRIVDGQQAKSYCALSYCRETIVRISTPDAAVSLESLPALFRDAVNVARELGYLHIWIDALCILKDDDWTHAAVIFANADLTISTLTTRNCDQRLYTPRDRRVLRPVPLDIGHPGKTLALLPDVETQATAGPVHDCGWALQEQLASPRILWFANGMLHWECLQGYRMEDNPSEVYCPVRERRYLGERNKTRRDVSAILSRSTTDTSPFGIWMTQIEEFTRRQVDGGDRLAAFCSLSESLAAAADNGFIAGAWKGDKLLQSLCWRRQPSSINSSMPSWSWAAAEGETSYDMIERCGKEDAISEIQVVSFEASQTSLRSSSARITIRGKVYRKQPLDSIFKGSQTTKLLDEWRKANIRLFPDRAWTTLGDVYTIDVLAFQGSVERGVRAEGPKTVKLLLEPVGDGGNVFRRVGIASAPGVTFQPDANSRLAKWIEQMRAGPLTSPYRWLFVDEDVEEREIVIV